LRAASRAVIEIELKITLDAAEEARLRRHPLFVQMRTAPRRTDTLLSVYFDTPDHALSRAGIALRLRKIGRRWVQTVKRGRTGGDGLFSHLEIERPAPGGRLALTGPDPEGVYRSIAEVTGNAALSPVFETRIRRVVERLRTEDGSEIELALDTGEVVAGEAHEPIHEAELELVSGEVGAVYDLARMLFTRGPVRLATDNKAARGYRLARGEPPPQILPRTAGVLDYPPEATVESVARDVFRDCHGQIAANLVVVAASDALEGPHQLRVGLRRLRTAFSVFAPSLGAEAIASLSEEARRLGQIVGRLRDIDVLVEEVVAAAAERGLDTEARAALRAVLDTRRAEVRAEVREALAAPDAVGFVFDLGRFIEGRGWLAPADYSQTERLATPIADLASGLLETRFRKVIKRGRKIRKLDVEGLHALRKQLKKLRYTADVLDPIFPGKKVTAFIKSLKQLQDTFGSLNDAAMVEGYLSGPEAPGRADAAVQRGAGWVLGTLAIQVVDDRPELYDRWDRLEKVKPFWR
jgi:inorganic triphosphatase YgiF